MSQSPYSPYAPPQPPSPYGQGPNLYAGAPRGQYEPLGWKTTALLVLVPLSVVINFILAIVTDPNQDPQHPDLGKLAVQGGLSLLSFAEASATWVIALMWIYRAASNVRAFGHEGFSISPGWAVGWWFIPIASLWMPFVAFREIWRGSDPNVAGTGDRIAWQRAPSSGLLIGWWLIYVGAGLVGAAAAIPNILASLRHERIQQSIPLLILTHLMSAAAGFLFITILQRVARRQEEAARRTRS